MQLLITASPENILAQLNESAVIQSESITWLFYMYTGTDYTALTIDNDIDVIAREFVAKSENRLATFGRI